MTDSISFFLPDDSPAEGSVHLDGHQVPFQNVVGDLDGRLATT